MIRMKIVVDIDEPIIPDDFRLPVSEDKVAEFVAEAPEGVTVVQLEIDGTTYYRGGTA